LELGTGFDSVAAYHLYQTAVKKTDDLAAVNDGPAACAQRRVPACCDARELEDAEVWKIGERPSVSGEDESNPVLSGSRIELTRIMLAHALRIVVGLCVRV
jgi:hypothetical protein